ncbi:MAG TPA: endonuclease VII domain-containing protein [Paludibaculum sp.]|jgi:hypothetical protein
MALHITDAATSILKHTKKRKPWRKSRYGLTDEQFDLMLISQGGRCAICGTAKWPHEGPHVDHDKKTGIVRGILCQACNTGIGKLKHDITIMQSAIAYLLKSNDSNPFSKNESAK